MATMTSVAPARQWFTEPDAARFRTPQKYELDLLQRLAGEFYAEGVPGEVREVAGRLGMSPTSWWRRTSGSEPTPLSRAGEEALRVRRAGYDVGFFGAYINVVSLLPDIENLTMAQANEVLIAAHAVEEASNAELNRHQFLHLAEGKPCFFGMAKAALRQKQESAAIARLALRLHLLNRA